MKRLKKMILPENCKELKLKKGQTIFVEQMLKEAILAYANDVVNILGKRVVKIKFSLEDEEMADVYFDNDEWIPVHLSIDNKLEFINYLINLGAKEEMHTYDLEGRPDSYKVLVLEFKE